MPGREVYLPGVFACALALPKRHLTEKPLELAREKLAREIVRLVPMGGIVCDLFAGSGTFLAAAKEAGMGWVGGETNTHYYEIAVGRLPLCVSPPN